MTKQFGTDERGIAHVLMFVLVIVVVAAVGFVGWEVMNHKQPAKTKTPLDAQTTGTKPSSSDAYAVCQTHYHDSSLCHFVSAETVQPLDKTAYKATLTSTQNGSNSSLVYEQDGKGDNALTTGDGAAGSALNSETVNGVLYVQNGSEWIKYPTSADQPPTQDPASDLSFMSALASTKFTKVGSEACGNLTCLKYSFTDSSAPGTTNYVWFDTHDYLLREWNSTDKSGNTADMKLSYQAITIKVPSPVVDFSPATQ